MRVTFGMVIYNEASEYLLDAIDSINKQLFDGFDVMLVNDNCQEELILQIQSKLKKKYQIVKGIYSQPSDLRIQLILEAKNRGVDLLVIGDCDDLFSNNRIQEVVEQYEEKYTFFYNELKDFKSNAIMGKLPITVDSFLNILDYNFLGMSNTALNLKLLTNEFIESLKEFRGNIFDWYLFSRILCDRGKGKIIKDTYTFYRIYSENLVGIPDLEEKNAINELNVKLTHYAIMSKFDNSYELKLRKYSKIKEGIETGKGLPELNCNNFWWSILR